MTITYERGVTDIVIWAPDGHPLNHVFEFDTESCQIMFYPGGLRYHFTDRISWRNPIRYVHQAKEIKFRFTDRISWRNPIRYVHQAKEIKFRNTPPDGVDSIIMTLPGAYATKWDRSLGLEPDPNAPRLH
jgi:hypothetical protein